LIINTDLNNKNTKKIMLLLQYKSGIE